MYSSGSKKLIDPTNASPNYTSLLTTAIEISLNYYGFTSEGSITENVEINRQLVALKAMEQLLITVSMNVILIPTTRTGDSNVKAEYEARQAHLKNLEKFLSSRIEVLEKKLSTMGSTPGPYLAVAKVDKSKKYDIYGDEIEVVS